jgi:hypothetical protein
VFVWLDSRAGGVFPCFCSFPCLHAILGVSYATFAMQDYDHAIQAHHEMINAPRKSLPVGPLPPILSLGAIVHLFMLDMTAQAVHCRLLPSSLKLALSCCIGHNNRIASLHSTQAASTSTIGQGLKSFSSPSPSSKTSTSPIIQGDSSTIVMRRKYSVSVLAINSAPP